MKTTVNVRIYGRDGVQAHFELVKDTSPNFDQTGYELSLFVTDDRGKSTNVNIELGDKDRFELEQMLGLLK